MSAVTLDSVHMVKMIIDEKERQLPKPTSNRPGYNMKYYRIYIANYLNMSIMDFGKFIANEKLYDKLSIMGWEESPDQWGLRVKSTLQNLLSRNERSIYHSFCFYNIALTLLPINEFRKYIV